ncbi:MAG: hypothetical protein ACLRNQ_06760 [Flavonifractor plautii]
MQNIDPYSYQCGVIDCFNEMVRSGVKALALSHPMDSAAERDALIPFARSCCHQYGNQLYIEDTPLLTDLFPLSLNQGKFNILFYRAEPHPRPVPAPEGAQGQSGGRAGLLRRQSQPARLGIRPAAVLPGRGHPAAHFRQSGKGASLNPSGAAPAAPSASFLLTWPGFRVIFV